MKTVKLADVCDISSGGTPSRSTPSFFQGDIPWAKISDLDNSRDGVVTATEENISLAGLQNIRNKLFKKGTLLFAMYGSIGKTGIAGRDMATNQAILGIWPRQSGEIDLHYLKAWFDTNKNRLVDQGRGVALKNLSATLVKGLDISIPSFNDQIRTARLLGKVERLIAERKQHLQQLDALLKSVFLEMFGDPVRNEKGWDKPALRAFGKISTGNTPPRNNPANYDDPYIEWIKTDNIVADAVFITQAAEHLSETGAKRARMVNRGALLVACIAGSVESIGRAALADRTVAFNQQINAIQPGKDVDSRFLHALFKLCRRYIQSHATKGMKKILTKGDFEQIPMVKPPIELQRAFANSAEKIEALALRYQQSLADLETLYAALSQQAFKGELDLSRVPLPGAVAALPQVAPRARATSRAAPMNQAAAAPIS